MRVTQVKSCIPNITFKDLAIGEMFMDRDDDLCVKISNNKNKNTIAYLDYDTNPIFIEYAPSATVTRIASISFSV